MPASSVNYKTPSKTGNKMSKRVKKRMISKLFSAIDTLFRTQDINTSVCKVENLINSLSSFKVRKLSSLETQQILQSHISDCLAKAAIKRTLVTDWATRDIANLVYLKYVLFYGDIVTVYVWKWSIEIIVKFLEKRNEKQVSLVNKLH